MLKAIQNSTRRILSVTAPWMLGPDVARVLVVAQALEGAMPDPATLEDWLGRK
jgi:hypothetical protein